MKKLTLLLSVLLLISCGDIRVIEEKQQEIVEAKLPEIEEGKGQLCICRSILSGVGASFTISVNGEPIVESSRPSFFCVNLRPGEYIITGGSGIGMETTIRQEQRRFVEFSGVGGLGFNITSREIGLSCINGKRMIPINYEQKNEKY